MSDPTRPEESARIPEESPEELGNTVDGSGAGDGSTSRGTDAGDRAEQARAYRTPEQPDHAVGGSDGTADGQ